MSATRSSLSYSASDKNVVFLPVRCIFGVVVHIPAIKKRISTTPNNTSLVSFSVITPTLYRRGIAYVLFCFVLRQQLEPGNWSVALLFSC